MSSLFDKLNLRPNERRLVIVVGIVLFIILNAIFVWPHFGDWNRLKGRREAALKTQSQYKQEIDKMPTYQKDFAELEKAGQTVNSEEQALKLSTTIYNQAALSGVGINNYVETRQSSASIKPNQFFDEKGGTVNVTAEEKSLVDFLYSLGMGGSLIRVRTMTLSRDPSQMRLQGNLTLVASYARKAPPKVAPAAAARPTAAATASTARSTNAGAKPSSPFSRLTNSPSKTNLPPKK